MQRPEPSIGSRAADVYRRAYYDVMPADWNRAQRRTAQGKLLEAQARLAAEKARADYLEEQLGIRENCKVVVEAQVTDRGTTVSDVRVDNEGLDNTHPARDDPRNWTEDYKHENGQYMNRCLSCCRIFYGHKRRIACKSCTTSQPTQLELPL